MECSNYRGISLLNIAYKILSSILFMRISPFAENIIGNYQCGFRKNRSTINQIFTLRQILEKTKEFSIETHHVFIDFRSAYDAIKREQLYNAMSEFNIPNKLIRLTRMTMANMKRQIRIQSDLSDPITTKKGVRQGDSLACLLFNLALEMVVRKAGIQTNGTIFYKSVQLLAYADDIDIIARSRKALKEAFLSLERAAREMGLRINEEKSKYLTTGVNKNQPKYFQIEKFKFEMVQSFTYLACIIDANNDISVEIKKRILLANKGFCGLKRQFRSQFLSKKNKIKLYKTLIRPVLACGSETWVLSKSDEARLGVFERKVLRAIFGPTNYNGEWRIKYNDKLHTLCKDSDIITYIKIKCLRWAGHVIRLEEQNPARRVFAAVVEGRRQKGRPKLRWEDGVKGDA